MAINIHIKVNFSIVIITMIIHNRRRCHHLATLLHLGEYLPHPVLVCNTRFVSVELIASYKFQCFGIQ